jgi:hypothetical protein
MSVAHAREHSLYLSYDANAPSPSGESGMVAGVPAAPFRGGGNTPSTHRNPAWINLAGSIAGLDFGHGRVDFVWPSDQDRRRVAAAPPLATQDNRHRPHHAGYHWIEVTVSLDQHPYDQRIGREDPQIPLAGVKRCDALGEGDEAVLEALVRGDTLDSILGRICRLFDALSVGSRCSILLVDHTADRLRYGAGPDLPAEYRTVIDAIPFGSSDAFWRTCPVNKEALVVADIVSDPAWCGFREFALAQGIRSCWSFPLVADDAVHGVLAIHHEELRGPDDREISRDRHLGLEHRGRYALLVAAAQEHGRHDAGRRAGSKHDVQEPAASR